VDVTYVPSLLATAIYTNSNFVTQSAANGAGSLSTSASLFLLNNSTSSNVGSVANLYNFKVYNPNLGLPFIRKNYNAQAARFGLPLATYIPPAPLLLDTYSGAAAAYSLRKLRTSYSGAAIRVRRSSDNTEANIGFNINGELDTIALLTFCGAGNGFVKTWYDQSGNGIDATQATAINQPQIVNGGVIELDNGQTALRFNGTNNFLLTSNYNFVSTDKIYTATVANSETNNSTRIIFSSWGGSVNNFISGYFQGTGRFSSQFRTTNLNFGLYNTNQQYLISTVFNTNELNIQDRINVYINNIQSAFNANTNNERANMPSSNQPLAIGSIIGGTLLMQGKIQEIIFYPSDQSSNRTGIETNINSFYSIY
jgi:hypothetical protein